MITKQQATEILHKNIENENLRKHHYAVAAAMRALAEYFDDEGKEKMSPPHSPAPGAAVKEAPGASPAAAKEGFNPEKWEIVGLLHDADYEETKDTPKRHAEVIAEKLQEEGVDEDIIHAIRAHNYEYLDAEPKSLMDWSLVVCDDLTGLIVAVALVHPDKLGSVTVESVMKKFNSSSFASGADRERIKLCEEKLGIPLEEFLGIVLSAMKENRSQLGL